jgi:hypothetical protein
MLRAMPSATAFMPAVMLSSKLGSSGVMASFVLICAIVFLALHETGLAHEPHEERGAGASDYQDGRGAQRLDQRYHPSRTPKSGRMVPTRRIELRTY